MLGVAATPALPWTDLVYLAAALVGAFGAFIAIPMYFFFLKDRQKVLLRQEVDDVSRRCDQLEVRVSELTKERDTLRDSLADERKRPNVDGIATILADVTAELKQIAETNGQILDKLSTMNGGLTRASEALAATNETARAQTEAIKFLAGQVIATDPFQQP